ncbi:MAG: hypothetical protein ABW178_00435 [Pseudoxanthomonas sp.]
MPLLIVLLVVSVVAGMWVLLLPWWLWRRYRMGRARQRLWPFWTRLNAWLFPVSVLLFLTGAAAASWAWPGAVRYAGIGLITGGVSGVIGLALGRLERFPDGSWHYTPSAMWMTLLMLAVLARLLLGALDLWRRLVQADALAWIPLFDHASLFAPGGLLLGHALVTAWSLHWRIRPQRPRTLD